MLFNLEEFFKHIDQGYDINNNIVYNLLGKYDYVKYCTNFVCVKDHYNLSLELLKVLNKKYSTDEIKIHHVSASYSSPQQAAIYYTDDGYVGHIIFSIDEDYDGKDIIYNQVYDSETQFRVFFSPYIIDTVIEFLKEQKNKHKIPKLIWNYHLEGRGRKSKDVFLKECPEIHEEYYPFIENGAFHHMKDFIESDCPIMLLYGPPGTGKTSFIRRLIYDYNLTASFTYDEKLFKDDSFFMEYLLGDECDLMIFEDADTMLGDRKRDQNTIMSKILNVSDGIVKIPTKKMLFSTNLSSLDEIDSALLRPGRCHSVIHFRELTQDEIDKAASKIGREAPKGKKKYTLAELFKQDQKVDVDVKRVGFL